MATTIKTVAGNNAPSIVLTCERNNDGTLTPIDVTGCTVTIKIVKGAVVTQAAGSCSLTTPASGVVTYLPSVTDFPSAGTYKADVKIVYTDTTHEILYDILKIKARAAL